MHESSFLNINQITVLDNKIAFLNAESLSSGVQSGTHLLKSSEEAYYYDTGVEPCNEILVVVT